MHNVIIRGLLGPPFHYQRTAGSTIRLFSNQDMFSASNNMIGQLLSLWTLQQNNPSSLVSPGTDWLGMAVWSVQCPLP